MNNFHKTILIVILSLFSLTASSQEFRLGNSYIPFFCTIERFDSICAKEYPQYTIYKEEYSDYEARHIPINTVLSYRFIFKEHKGQKFIAQSFVNKIVSSLKVAKAEIKASKKIIDDSYTYDLIRKDKNKLGLYDYRYQLFGNSLITFTIFSFKDEYGLIHCCSANEYPTPY